MLSNRFLKFARRPMPNLVRRQILYNPVSNMNLQQTRQMYAYKEKRIPDMKKKSTNMIARKNEKQNDNFVGALLILIIFLSSGD
jgi:hypothetical protein